MFPVVTEVVRVGDAHGGVGQVDCERHHPTGTWELVALERVRIGNTDLGGCAGGGISHVELVQVKVEPPHGVLDGDVQVPEGVRRGHFDPAPNDRLAMGEGDLENECLALALHGDRFTAWTSCIDELAKYQTDAASNLSQEQWRDISTSVEGHGSRTPVGMPELSVGAALANLDKAKPFKPGDDLASPKYWTPSHD